MKMSELYKLWSEYIKPPDNLLVSDWADAKRILPGDAAEPGKYRTSRVEYLREIMDNFSLHSPIQQTWVLKSSQSGVTEAGLNWAGYIADYVKASMMIVWADGKMVEENSKKRVDGLINSTPTLKEIFTSKSSKQTGDSNTTHFKTYPGGAIQVASAGSPNDLVSRPHRYAMCDEIDEYKSKNVVDLVIKRFRTFGTRWKILVCSKPSTISESIMWEGYLLGDRREFNVDCPFCQEEFFFEWKGLKWDKKKPTDVWYECPHCKQKLRNFQKDGMISKGRWKPTVESKKENYRSYHISALYAPVGWTSWEDLVQEWLTAQHNQRALRNFYNDQLGLPFDENTDAVDWEVVKSRQEYHWETGVVPDGVVLLTVGVDIQGNRIEATVTGWGRRMNSWNIDYRVFVGDTGSLSSQCWYDLETLLGSYYSKNGKKMPISGACIDANYETANVYHFVRRYPQTRVFAIHGSDNLPVVSSSAKPVDNIGGIKMRSALFHYQLGVSYLKGELMHWLRQNKDTDEFPFGWIHTPYDRDEEWYKQLCAERREVVPSSSSKYGSKFQWVKMRERNEALDTYIYSRGAAHLIGYDQWNENHFNEMFRLFPDKAIGGGVIKIE